MAETVALPGLTPEVLTGFLGVNLRRDRVSLRDQDLARALNFDLHSQVGTPTRRQGRTVLLDGLGAAVRGLLTLGSARYSLAGTTLAINGTSLVTTLDAGVLRTSLAAQRPLSDPTTWVFIADDSGMQKTD